MEVKSKFLEVYKRVEAKMTLLLNTMSQGMVRWAKSLGEKPDPKASLFKTMITHFRILR